MSQDSIYFFLIRARPRVGSATSGGRGGAFVNCWIDRPTMDEAEAVARALIEVQQWDVESVEQAFLADRSCYCENSDGLRYHEQALLDKTVLVFHTYPVEGRCAAD